MPLKISFTVQDVDTQKFVTFNDEVVETRVKDFFERCGLAVDQLFGLSRASSVIMLRQPCANKIWAIKVVKDLTGLGLKESKDLVESQGPLILCETSDEARAVIDKFTAQSVAVDARPANMQTMLQNKIPQVLRPI